MYMHVTEMKIQRVQCVFLSIADQHYSYSSTVQLQCSCTTDAAFMKAAYAVEAMKSVGGE